MRPPLIGITTYRAINRYGHTQICVNEAYIHALTAAGAVPSLIPLGLTLEQLDAILERIDGIVFTGGGDIHPERSGSQWHPRLENVDADRDRVEIHLVTRSVEREMPFLGICRGLQVINIAFGGSLYMDIQDQRPDSLQHQSPEEWQRDRPAHSVQILPDTRLRAILASEELLVNSHHHQAIRHPGEKLKISAYSPDGIIEALEVLNYPYGLAVQWHPEWMNTQAPMLSLFQSLSEAASQSGQGIRNQLFQNI
jgi:putative glutamine amidotransferase